MFDVLLSSRQRPVDVVSRPGKTCGSTLEEFPALYTKLDMSSTSSSRGSVPKISDLEFSGWRNLWWPPLLSGYVRHAPEQYIVVAGLSGSAWSTRRMQSPI